MAASPARSTEANQPRSRPVYSNQAWTHPGLPALVRKHLHHPARKPIARHNRQAFEQLLHALSQRHRPLVLDSFCGTGHSTVRLAQRHPDHLVVGIDKSAHRLGKHPVTLDGSYLLLRADCEDIWQLLAGEGPGVDFHYLLYPNPWPKSSQLKRRVQGHPALASLLALGGQLELRSNWQVYVEEFGLALTLAGLTPGIQQLQVTEPMTLFEKKYADSDHVLWRCRARLVDGP